jgi:hypothetical protein
LVVMVVVVVMNLLLNRALLDVVGELCRGHSENNDFSIH